MLLFVCTTILKPQPWHWHGRKAPACLPTGKVARSVRLLLKLPRSPKCICFFVCALGVPEMMDELGRLSDSTSEEHSIHSYTSESFDDNGERWQHVGPWALRLFFPPPLSSSNVTYCRSPLKNYPKKRKIWISPANKDCCRWKSIGPLHTLIWFEKMTKSSR